MVEVLWDDATELDGGWTNEIEDADDPHLALSVGFLLRKSRTHIVIAQDVDKDGYHNGRSQIPRGMVKKIHVLRKADR